MIEPVRPPRAPKVKIRPRRVQICARVRTEYLRRRSHFVLTDGFAFPQLSIVSGTRVTSVPSAACFVIEHQRHRRDDFSFLQLDE
jgi:hypothetical protein